MGLSKRATMGDSNDKSEFVISFVCKSFCGSAADFPPAVSLRLFHHSYIHRGRFAYVVTTFIRYYIQIFPRNYVGVILFYIYFFSSYFWLFTHFLFAVELKSLKESKVPSAKLLRMMSKIILRII